MIRISFLRVKKGKFKIIHALVQKNAKTVFFSGLSEKKEYAFYIAFEYTKQ